MCRGDVCIAILNMDVRHAPHNVAHIISLLRMYSVLKFVDAVSAFVTIGEIPYEFIATENQQKIFP